MRERIQVVRDVLGDGYRSRNEHLFHCPFCNHHKKKLSLRKTYFFDIQGVEVESKNQSKIDVKNDAETEGLGNSIFIDF